MSFKYFTEGDITLKTLWQIILKYHYRLLILPAIFATITLIAFSFSKPIWKITGLVELDRKLPEIIRDSAHPNILRQELFIPKINRIDFIKSVSVMVKKKKFNEPFYNDTLTLNCTYFSPIDIKTKAISKKNAHMLLMASFDELKNIQNNFVDKYQIFPITKTPMHFVGKITEEIVTIPPRRTLILVMFIIIGFLISIFIADFHFHRKSQ